MSDKVRKELDRIMSDMNFHPTLILLQTMAQMYEEFGIIDKKILDVINKRYEKNKDKYEEMINHDN